MYRDFRGREAEDQSAAAYINMRQLEYTDGK